MQTQRTCRFHRQLVWTILITAAAAYVPVALAQRPDAASAAVAPASSADVASGNRLFQKYLCFTCHGTDGQGGLGPRLSPPYLLPFEVLRSYVRNPPTQTTHLKMPPYRSSAVSDTELREIYAYLESIPVSPAAKNIPLLNE